MRNYSTVAIMSSPSKKPVPPQPEHYIQPHYIQHVIPKKCLNKVQRPQTAPTHYEDPTKIWWSWGGTHHIDLDLNGAKLIFSGDIRKPALFLQEWSYMATSPSLLKFTWLEKVLEIDHLDSFKAMSMVYDRIDRMLNEANITDVDQLLSQFDVSRGSVDLIISILTVTAAAKSRLDARNSFFKRVDQRFRERGEFEEGLLNGLD